ncbi:MAG: ATP-binding protein [Anaerolineales bacterium]
MLDEQAEPNTGFDNSSDGKSSFRSLKDLIEHVSGKRLGESQAQQDSGLAEVLPFPFLAMVGQEEMKYALLLALVNPAIGGVLLIGPRGTGKTTAIRGLVDLVPEVPRSLCYYGCLPEDIEIGGIDAVCPNCAQKYARGEPLAALDKVRLVELPLNARIEDVVGVVDDASMDHQRLRLHRGILGHADRNLLLVDEVNLLSDEVVDAILDAAAYGSYTVRRGSTAATYRARFVLIGTMNPEEGRLRPQIMDRFGLRLVIRGLDNIEQRLEAYKRVQTYLSKPRQVMLEYSDETRIAQAEIQLARDILPEVKVPEQVSKHGLDLIQQLNIDSLRAEITLFESSRALAALDNRKVVTLEDLSLIAPMALRMRRSKFIEKYLSNQNVEEKEIKKAVNEAWKTS